ncbi:MAG TPA: TRAP transporter substrate-binding protein [Methylomirabilota bacterium]|nr:TRAP transporter substrate-binding protein [Methylomirabilota bacterium]
MMRIVGRVVAVLLVLTLLAAIDGGGPAAQGKVVIKFSHNQQTITPPHKAAEMFKQLVEQRTKGYYDVQIFPAQQLGGLRDQVEGTSLGTIELTQQTPPTVSLLVPKVMVLDFPFLWPSEDAMWRVLDGPVGQELLQSLETKGLKGVDFWSSGFKNITSGRKPIRTPDDLKGMKIRVIPSPLLSAQYEAWGASPTPVDFKELYTALQQGLVDGQENPAGTIVDVKLYEVQKFMTESRHGFLHYIMMFNKKWFDAQPKANQEILVQAVKEAGRWERKAMADRDADAVRRIKQAGLEVTALTPQAREQFRQLSLKVHEKFADRVDKDFLRRLYAEIEKASKK